MRGELPYFSDIDNIWTYKLLSQILSVIAAKKHSTVCLQLNLNQSDVLALFIDRIFEPHEQKWARLRVKSWVDSESNVFRLSHQSIWIETMESHFSQESIWIKFQETISSRELIWINSWKPLWVMSWVRIKSFWSWVKPNRTNLSRTHTCV